MFSQCTSWMPLREAKTYKKLISKLTFPLRDTIIDYRGTLIRTYQYNISYDSNKSLNDSSVMFGRALQCKHYPLLCK